MEHPDENEEDAGRIRFLVKSDTSGRNLLTEKQYFRSRDGKGLFQPAASSAAAGVDAPLEKVVIGTEGLKVPPVTCVPPLACGPRREARSAAVSGCFHSRPSWF